MSRPRQALSSRTQGPWERVAKGASQARGGARRGFPPLGGGGGALLTWRTGALSETRLDLWALRDEPPGETVGPTRALFEGCGGRWETDGCGCTLGTLSPPAPPPLAPLDGWAQPLASPWLLSPSDFPVCLQPSLLLHHTLLGLWFTHSHPTHSPRGSCSCECGSDGPARVR